MGKIVSAMSLSHAPGLLSLPDAPPEEQLGRMHAALSNLANQLEEEKPDLIIALLDDHFENYFRLAMPTFSVGIGGDNYGPPQHYEQWLKVKRKKIAGHPDYAREILIQGLADGFDLGRSEKIEYGHNLVAPLHYIRPEFDIPVVPIFIDTFTLPLASTKRVYDLGVCLRKVIDRRPEKVALIATGGLSHWPPYWNENSPKSDIYNRMKRFQTEGLSVLQDDPNLFVDFGQEEVRMAASGAKLINPDWDHEILSAFERGDVNYFVNLTYEEMEEHGGNGGHEIFNWIALMGVLNGAPSKTLSYENVKEWMCGMAIISYDQALKSL
jgi:2,3-dihydroxyphenylpropionate 1,2-dioxygenase